MPRKYHNNCYDIYIYKLLSCLDIFKMYRFPIVCLYFNKLKYILKTVFGCFKYQFTKGEIVFNIIELCISLFFYKKSFIIVQYTELP